MELLWILSRRTAYNWSGPEAGKTLNWHSAKTVFYSTWACPFNFYFMQMDNESEWITQYIVQPTPLLPAQLCWLSGSRLHLLNCPTVLCIMTSLRLCGSETAEGRFISQWKLEQPQGVYTTFCGFLCILILVSVQLKSAILRLDNMWLWYFDNFP